MRVEQIERRAAELGDETADARIVRRIPLLVEAAPGLKAS